ncbi:ubiquitin-like domain-containing protein [Planococcus sp. APC 3906]|uniref:G5 and 3D domain-containing protein n=1 Tax=Planococcus sp. APC 3906 TaxID=3035194 RepID=UPI0025B3F62F|nr:G5 and 3D domain-containing protein [Planococcus sp. APC 3906]MDN3451166.1 ubiquitin-like domain-containing protein [Planococcus sp. APC 3906]
MTKLSTNGKSVNALKGKSIVVAIATVLMFAAVLTFAIYEGTKNTVSITANGETTEVKTHAETVGAFLKEQEINVSEHDYLSHTADTAIEKDIALEFEQAKEYTVNVDGKKAAAWTTNNTVREILNKAAIEITEHDKVSPGLDEEIDADTAVSVEKAYEVTVLDGLEEKKVWSTSTTVADFLKQNKISLSELDRVENGMDEMVLPNSEVKVVRVEKVTDVVEDSVKFAVETKKDSSILKGKEKVVQKGQNGVVSKTYEVIKENGKEVKRELKDKKVVKEPKKQLTAVGTKVIVASVSRGARTKAAAPAPKATAPKVAAPKAPAPKATAPKTAAPKAAEPKTASVAATAPAEPAGRTLIVSATAYTASCTGCSGITATGINLKANPGLKVIAVDPNVIPLGSKVYVEGYGYAVAGDTGGAIKGNKIDLFMAKQSSAIAFGRQQVKVTVLN